MLEVDGHQAIVAMHGTSLLTEEGEWVEVTVEEVRARAAHADVVLEVAEWSMPSFSSEWLTRQSRLHPQELAADGHSPRRICSRPGR